MPGSTEKIEIKLLGPFAMRDSCGKDITPRGRKTCALFAILAVSADMRRSRRWVQDRLWSDRGAQQGSASLRQCLVEAKRILGPENDILIADHFNLTLNSDLVDVDLDRARLGKDTALKHATFLEGFDIRDSEFEEWLRLERQALEAELMSDDSHEQPTEPEVRTAATRLILASTQSETGSVKADFSTQLLDGVGQSISEIGTAAVTDLRLNDECFREDSGSQSDVTVVLNASRVQHHEHNHHHASLANKNSGQVIWSSSVDLTDTMKSYSTNESLAQSVNQITAIATNEFLRTSLKGAKTKIASAICAEALSHLYKLGANNFLIADQLFAKAFELEPKGIYLGWRAYTRTFMLAERQFTCRQTVREEAEEFIERALELDPYNSYIAAFAAQVHNIINRSYVAAGEFAQRSVALNSHNAIGWSQLGAAKCYLGDVSGGFKDTKFAVRVSGNVPYRFQLAGICCIAGTMAGDIDGAIEAGEIGHALASNFSPPMRYLSVLYLHRKNRERSESILKKLRKIEPEFSLDSLKDKSYPSAGLQESGLLHVLPTL